MFVAQNTASSPLTQPAVKLTTDYLLRWYQIEYKHAATIEARAAVVRNARNDGYTAAQFMAVIRG